MKVHSTKSCDEALLAEVNTLLPQLSSSSKPLNSAQLRAVIESDATTLLVAREASRIAGMLTLVVFRIPTGVRAWVEDVVVCESSRGKGVGRTLLEAAIQLARERGAKTVDLTSRPAREAANRLYQRAGFVRRDTNVYRITL